ncbi:universal stress protein [Mycobacterium sp.]|uniref:universal stress protein n=1 Tax=Mycobacterium sp. TaxID=1785 RepID=UPI001286BBCC|nr:universal stress protein [Mycobacterium sp.]KAA8958477.1 MAG: universal stress protein [Mycobacterium sp.]
MALVVGYDPHPASRAALVFAGELAGALNVPVHVVHVVDGPDTPAELERQRVADALGGPDLQWSYHRITGDPAKVLVKAADEHSAMMLVVGRPEQGVEATLGHLVAGSVARNVLRHSRCPVLVVPEYGGGPR